MQELVRLGHGVSLSPAMAARADTTPGCVYRSLSGDKPMRTIALAYNRLRYQSRLFQRFAGVIRAAAPG